MLRKVERIQQFGVQLLLCAGTVFVSGSTLADKADKNFYFCGTHILVVKMDYKYNKEST